MVNVIAPMLTAIFKKSRDYGVVPEDWKTANITPVFKKGKRSDAKLNYRPISLTCIAFKLMQHILTSHIMIHMAYNLASEKVNLVKHSWWSLLMT